MCVGQIPLKEEPIVSVITYMQSQLPENNGFALPDLPIKENEKKTTLGIGLHWNHRLTKKFQ